MNNLEPIQKHVITHSQLVKYSGASGDFNPIHTVVKEGKKAGFEGVIVHGMLIMGFAGQALNQWFERKQVREFYVRFTAVTVPGEKITIKGWITGEIVKSGEKLITGELFATNQCEDIKLNGIFKVAK